MCAQFVIPTTPQSLSEIWYALNKYKCLCLLLSRTHRKEQMSVLMALQWLHHSRCSRADELSWVECCWAELSVVELSWVLSAVELTRWSLMITEGQGTPQQMFNCSCAVGNSARTPLYRRTIKSSQIEIFLVFRMFETIKIGRHSWSHQIVQLFHKCTPWIRFATAFYCSRLGTWMILGGPG